MYILVFATSCLALTSYHVNNMENSVRRLPPPLFYYFTN